jgi:Fe-S oxidoreductase
MKYFDIFVIPFSVGTIFLFAVLIFKFFQWFFEIPKSGKLLIAKNFISLKTLKSIWECLTECLLHLRIFRKNLRLGYMHTSIAFGWFMLIVVGKFQSTAATGVLIEPPHLAIFLKYFFPVESFTHAHLYGILMDFFLFLVLSGLVVAIIKRMRPRVAGLKRPTKHTSFDRVALVSLWAIFPLRLLAESFTSGYNHSGNFLTGTLGDFFDLFLPLDVLQYPTWWAYSLALGSFFCVMPFSRYMHIFTEIGLIFLRNWGLKTEDKLSGFANFELHACSRCGMCIDVCQLSTSAMINTVQSVYFLRGERQHTLSRKLTNNCLMCGRCEEVCPVLIKTNQHRLLTRTSPFENQGHRYNYLTSPPKPPQRGGCSANVSLPSTAVEVGDRTQREPILPPSGGTRGAAYYAGCMTHLTPSIKTSMLRIFEKAGVNYTFIDEQQGACCGRPMLLSGAKEASQKMIDFNKKLIEDSQAQVLVTSCPICYKFFKENYRLNIPVMHHTEYIAQLLQEKKIKLNRTAEKYIYHDPCELGRLSGIYEQPRDILKKTGILVRIPEERENAFCCGGSLANTEINYAERGNIVRDVIESFCAQNPDYLVTACPLCKKSFNKERTLPVKDIAEVVANRL